MNHSGQNGRPKPPTTSVTCSPKFGELCGTWVANLTPDATVSGFPIDPDAVTGTRENRQEQLGCSTPCLNSTY